MFSGFKGDKFMDKKKLRGMICAIIGGICWGFSGCCGQYLFEYKNTDPYLLSTIRLLASGIILLIIAAFTQRKNLIDIWKCKTDVIKVVCFGILGMMMCQLSYLIAIKHTNAATATVIQYVGPVLVMLVVCIMKQKLPTVFEVTSLILAVVGTYLIATHGDPSSLAISPVGLIWCIIAAISVVTYTLIPGDLTKRRSSAVVSGYGMTIGGIVLLIVCQSWNIPITLDLETIFALIGIVVFGTVVAFSLYLQAVSDIGPVKASIIASIEPVSSAVISWLWLGSTFNPIDIVGFVCIISTVFLLAVKKKDRD